MDQEIERWLKRIVLSLGLDRSTLYEVKPDGEARVSHQWARPGLPPTPMFTNVRKVAPWAAAKVLSGQTFQFASLDQLPPQAAKDRETYRSTGNKSNVTVPVKVGNAVVGGVAFGTLRHERKWSPEVVGRLEQIAQVFGFALERKRAVVENQRLRRELTRASQIAAMAELAASLAHELSPLLAAILRNANEVNRHLAPEQPELRKIRRAVQEIIQDDRCAAKAIRSVRSLFKRARLSKSGDLKSLLDELTRVLRSDRAMRNVALSLEGEALLKAAQPPREWVAHLDREHLKRLYGTLTLRERQVFGLVAGGLRSKQVGIELGIAEKTVKVHRAHVMEKLKAQSLAELVRIASCIGL
jgi:DNA-binding NarL/FixJ family response regulator